MNSDERRWLEIQFYFICRRFLNATGNLGLLAKFIRGMAFYHEYDADNLCQVANIVLPRIEFQPSRDEYVILAYKFGIPIHVLHKQVHVTRKTIYDILKRNEIEPRRFVPYLKDDKHELIKELIETMKLIEESLNGEIIPKQD